MNIFESFDAEDDPMEPHFDPLHLGATLIVVMVAIGALFWLLWTLLVFEGGLFGKLLPSLQVLFRFKTLADFGYQGPWDRGLFEGWLGNLSAFIMTVGAVVAVSRLYESGAKRRRGS